MMLTLTPELEKYVRNKVAGGQYHEASEVIEDALRQMLERDAVSSEATPALTKEDVRSTLLEEEAALRKRGVVSLALFGSFVRGEETPASDIDLLIDIDHDSNFSLFDLAGIKCDLEGILARGVDIVTREGIDCRIRDQAFAEAERIF